MSNENLDKSFKNIIAELIANPGICSIDDVFNEIEKIVDQTNDIDINLLSKYIYTIAITIVNKNSNNSFKNISMREELLQNIINLPGIKSKEKRRLLG